jgi:hypothetical protein
MRTENFNHSAEAFNENVKNSIKWMQQSSEIILEAQSKQMKFATDLYANMFSSYFGNFEKMNAQNTSFGMDKISKMITGNIEHIVKMSEESMKVMSEFSSQTNSGALLKETSEKIMDFYKKQFELMTSFNQNSMNALTKEINLSKMFVMPFSENIKNEFGYGTQFFNDSFKDMMAFYTNFSNPSFASNQNTLNEYASQMQAAFQKSVDVWSSMLRNYNIENYNASVAEDVTKKETVKETASSSKSKTAVHA